MKIESSWLSPLGSHFRASADFCSEHYTILVAEINHTIFPGV